jgi:hypothetical protein
VRPADLLGQAALDEQARHLALDGITDCPSVRGREAMQDDRLDVQPDAPRR